MVDAKDDSSDLEELIEMGQENLKSRTLFNEAGIPNMRENFAKPKKTFKARPGEVEDANSNQFLRALRSGKVQDGEKSGFANYFVSVLTDKFATKNKKIKEAEIDRLG